MYNQKEAPVIKAGIYGLGGRDIFVEDIEKVFKDLEDIAKTGKVKSWIDYIGVRE